MTSLALLVLLVLVLLVLLLLLWMELRLEPSHVERHRRGASAANSTWRAP